MKPQRRQSAIMMLNSANYLNSIAMKYRFEQMRMNNIVQKINRKALRRKRENLMERLRNSLDDNEGKANEKEIHGKNLFERLQHKGSVLDSDIRKGQKILANIKQKRIIEGDDKYEYALSEDSDEISYERETSEKRKEKIDAIIQKNKRNEKKVEFHLKEMNTNNSFQEFFDVINSPDEQIAQETEEKKPRKVFHIKKINLKEVKSTKSKTTINKKPTLLYQYENRHNSILNDNCNKMRNNLQKELSSQIKKENSTGGFSCCDFRSSQYSSFRFSPQASNIKLTKKAFRVGDVINFYHPSSVGHKTIKFKEKKINFPLLKKPFHIAPYSCRSSSMEELNAQNEENLIKMRAMAEKRTKGQFNSLSMQLGKIQKNVELIINTTTMNFFSKVNKLMSSKL